MDTTLNWRATKLVARNPINGHSVVFELTYGRKTGKWSARAFVDVGSDSQTLCAQISRKTLDEAKRDIVPTAAKNLPAVLAKYEALANKASS